MTAKGDVAGAECIQTTILIPAYNEEEALPHVLKAIFDVIDDTFEVIVVNDGSCDGTKAVASTFPCRVVSHDVNRGKGAAMQTGLRYAQGQKTIFIDGDGTYPAEAVLQVAAQLEHYDLVRCIRCGGRGNIPLVNRLGNAIFDRILGILHGVDGADLLSGLYGMRKSQLIAMQLASTGFDIESEIAVKAKAMNLKSASIPIHYYKRLGNKKLKPFKDGARILSRVLSLVLAYNPVATFIVPGLALWALAVAGLLVLSFVPVRTPYFVPSTNSFVVSTMAFLAGFQLVVFGYVATLYAAESGLYSPNPMLIRLVEKIPLLGGVFFSLGSILVGLGWSLSLVLTWVANGFGRFGVRNTETLVMTLALIVWGVQLLCTLLFLSLFASRAKHMTLGNGPERDNSGD